MVHLLQGMHILLQDIKCINLLDLKTSLGRNKVIPPLSLFQDIMMDLSLTNTMMKAWMHTIHLRNNKRTLSIILIELFLPWKILMMTFFEHFLTPISSCYLSLAHMETHYWISIVLIIDIMRIVLQIALS